MKVDLTEMSLSQLFMYRQICNDYGRLDEAEKADEEITNRYNDYLLDQEELDKSL